MNKRALLTLLAVVVVAGALLAAQGKDSSWTGYITDSHCGAQKDFAKHAACAKKCVDGGLGKWALYTPADKKLYTLEPGDKVDPFAGKQVKVTGSLSGETIKVSAIEEVK